MSVFIVDSIYFSVDSVLLFSVRGELGINKDSPLRHIFGLSPTVREDLVYLYHELFIPLKIVKPSEIQVYNTRLQDISRLCAALPHTTLGGGVR